MIIFDYRGWVVKLCNIAICFRWQEIRKYQSFLLSSPNRFLILFFFFPTLMLFFFFTQNVSFYNNLKQEYRVRNENKINRDKKFQDVLK